MLPRDEGRADAQAQLDNAICAAARASTGLGQVLAEGYPVRAVALAEFGKLLSVDKPDAVHARAPVGLPTGTIGVAPGWVLLRDTRPRVPCGRRTYWISGWRGGAEAKAFDAAGAVTRLT